MIIFHVDLGLKFLLCLNGKCFNFKDKPIQILWTFNCNYKIILRPWLKMVLSKGCVQAEIAVHIYTIVQC